MKRNVRTQITVLASAFVFAGGITHTCHGQTPVAWSRQIGSAGDDRATAITIDSSQNIYVAGTTTGNLFGSNTGGTNSFLMKYGPNGNVVWSQQFGSSGEDVISALAVDAGGDVYTVGRTTGNLFGQNASTIATGSDPSDVFLAKFDPTGMRLWGKQFGTVYSDAGLDIHLDAYGDVYIAGSTDGDLFGRNAGYDANPAVAFGGSDFFLAHYDPNGNQLWAQQYGALGSDGASAFALDAASNFYIAGSTYEQFSTGHGASDAMIAEYTNSGFLFWGKQISGSQALVQGEEFWYNAISRMGNGTLLVSGNVNAGDADFTSRGRLTEYDSRGNLIWDKQLSSSDSSGNLEGAEITSSVVDLSNNVVAVGYTYGSLFSPNIGGKDYFLVKYNSSGGLIWNQQYGTSGDDGAAAVCVDSSGNMYVTGTTSGTLFAPNAGGDDVFIQKISSTGQMNVSANLSRPSPYKSLAFAWSGQSITLSYPPVLANKRPYLYAGYLCSGIPGAKVRQTATKQIVVEGQSKQVVITPNVLLYRINGKPHTMSAKPVMVGNRCYVPLDVMKAVLPYPVHYDVRAQTVHFDPPQRKTARR